MAHCTTNHRMREITTAIAGACHRVACESMPRRAPGNRWRCTAVAGTQAFKDEQDKKAVDFERRETEAQKLRDEHEELQRDHRVLNTTHDALVIREANQRKHVASLDAQIARSLAEISDHKTAKVNRRAAPSARDTTAPPSDLPVDFARRRRLRGACVLAPCHSMTIARLAPISLSSRLWWWW